MRSVGNQISGATFSDCRKWRYALWRRWEEGGTDCVFIGLNPSTADEFQNDPTITRCIRFARDWGHARFVMLNLFGWRATLPKNMKAQAEPVGAENDTVIEQFTAGAHTIVAAWGNHGTYQERDILATYRRSGSAILADRLQCLEITGEGCPKHPLYVAAATKLKPYVNPFVSRELRNLALLHGAYASGQVEPEIEAVARSIVGEDVSADSFGSRLEGILRAQIISRRSPSRPTRVRSKA
jgi:hypothetical protein